MQRSLFGTKDSSGEAKNGSGQLVTLKKKTKKTLTLTFFLDIKKNRLLKLIFHKFKQI